MNHIRTNISFLILCLFILFWKIRMKETTCECLYFSTKQFYYKLQLIRTLLLVEIRPTSERSAASLYFNFQKNFCCNQNHLSNISSLWHYPVLYNYPNLYLYQPSADARTLAPQAEAATAAEAEVDLNPPSPLSLIFDPIGWEEMMEESFEVIFVFLDG